MVGSLLPQSSALQIERLTRMTIRVIVGQHYRFSLILFFFNYNETLKLLRVHVIRTAIKLLLTVLSPREETTFPGLKFPSHVGL